MFRVFIKKNKYDTNRANGFFLIKKIEIYSSINEMKNSNYDISSHCIKILINLYESLIISSIKT